MRRPRHVLPALVLLASCAVPSRTPAPATRPSLPSGSGLVHVYLSTTQAAAPAFETPIVAIAAIREDGAEAPLEIVPRDSRALRDLHDRLVARGSVSAGRFVALSVTVEATAPLRIPVSFTVTERSGTVLALAPRPGPSEPAATPPEAAFAAEAVARPALGLIGLAACPGGGIVAVFDKRLGRVTGIVPTGRNPSSLSLDFGRRRVFVAALDDEAIETIDLEQGVVTQRRLLRAGDEPADLALLPDGRTLLVANRGSASVAFLETDSLAEVDRVEVGNGPVALAVDRAGLRAYALNRLGNSVAVIDTASRSVVKTVSLDAGPVRAQFDKTQATLWILYEGSPYLDGLDTRSLEIAHRLNLGAGATAIRIDTRTGRVFAARRDGTGIDVYDAMSLLPVDMIPVSGRVAYLAIDGETNELLASLPDAGDVVAFGLVGRARVWASETGGGPSYLTVMGER